MKSKAPHSQPGRLDALLHHHHHRHVSPEECERSHRRIIRRVWFAFGIVGVLLGIMVWSADVISMEDERTIYTLDCQQGQWVDGRCTGRVKAGDRIRFRASKDRNEVLFWKVGAPHQTGRLAPCRVQDGRNWSCASASDAPASVQLASVPLSLTQGRVQPDANGASTSFHGCKKWRWWLLKAGIPA